MVRGAMGVPEIVDMGERKNAKMPTASRPKVSSLGEVPVRLPENCPAAASCDCQC